MARDEARVFTRIWLDDQFRAKRAQAQRLFLFLLSQQDLTYAGTLALRVRKWAHAAPDLTPATVREALDELAEPDPSGNPSANGSANGALVIVDEDTEEVLIRSLIRLDGVWKIPNLMRAARNAAALVESAKLRAVMLDELLRIRESDEFRERAAERPHVAAELALFVEQLGGPSADPQLRTLADGRWTGSRNGNAKGSAKGSRKGSANPSAKGRRGKGEVVRSTTRRTNTGSKTSEADEPQPTTEQTSLIPSDVRRLDVERICNHLADRIAAHGVKRPAITQKWRDAARLMLDADGIPADHIHRAIDWAHDNEFWRANVLSLPNLRKHYAQMLMQAKRTKATPQTGGKPSKAAAKQAATEAAMQAALAVEAAATGHDTTPATATATATRIVIAGELE